MSHQTLGDVDLLERVSDRPLARGNINLVHCASGIGDREKCVYTYIWFIEVWNTLVRVTQVDAGDQIFRAWHVDGPELPAHHAVFHLLEVAVASDALAVEVVVVDLVVQLLSQKIREVVVTVDQRRTLKQTLCPGHVVRRLDRAHALCN